MTANEKLTSKLTRQQLAEQVRIKHRSFNLPNAAEPHPAPEIVGLIGEGLLTKVLLDQTDVTVIVKALNEYHEGDTGKLQLLDPSKMIPDPEKPGGPMIPTVVYEGASKDLPKNETGYPQYFALPSDELDDYDKVHHATRYQVRVVVTQGDSGNDIFSKELDIGVDRHAPYQSKQDGSYLRPVKVKVLNVPGEIDEQWLIDNTHLKLEVDTSYQFYSPSDRIKISISTTEPGVDGPLPNEVFSGGLISTGLIDIPVRDFESEVKNDGPIYVSFTLNDEPGNESKVSFNTSLNVVLRPQPEFKKPRIPIVGDGGTLNFQTLQSKIYVYIDRGDHWFNNDNILLQIRSTPGGTPIDVDELPVGTGNLLRFELRYLDLKLLPTDRETPIPVEVLYQLKRGIEAPRPSPATAFTLDFTEAGPDNPDLPSLTNPKMVKVGLKGKSGTLNHITGADRGELVTIQTPMDSGGSWTILGSEIARLWYNGVKVYELPLKGDETELTHDIPPATIDSGSTGKKLAWWDITGDKSSNTWLSEKTEVIVDAAIVEFDAPSAPTFPITDGGVRKEVVNCKSLTFVGSDRQLVVTVPINATYMPKDSVVVVHSVGTTDRLGFEPIESTRFLESYTITGSEVGNVFTVNIKPYVTKIKPIQPTQDSGQLNGAIKIWYVVQVNGVSVPSDDFLHEVRLLASGLYCEGTPTL